MINITSSHHNSRGFTMVEALVGLTILALGLLSLAKFQTSLVENSGLTKARTAAINLGQDKVEELRNLINREEFITIATGSDTRTGTNTTYTRAWNISNAPTGSSDPDRLNIDVTVSWTDAANTEQSIKISSIIAWLDPAAISKTTTSTSNTIATLQYPGAGTVTGDGELTLDTSDDDLEISDQAPDTTRIAKTSGGIIYLIDEFDVILLTATAPLTTISGIIGLSDVARTTEKELPLLDIVTSDAGYCSYPLNPENGKPDSSPSQTKAYICYVAGGWYGGIGVFGYKTDEDVCAGKIREYRGELRAADGTVIGTHGVTDNQSGDDFILTVLNNNETCGDVIIPEGFTDTNSDGLPGPIKGTIVTDDKTIGSITLSGTITIDTTSEPAASSQYTSLIVETISTNDLTQNGTCDAVVYNPGDAFATYSCEIENGWSGFIVLSGINGSDRTCVNVTSTPVESTVIDLSDITINGNLTGKNFNIVGNGLDCY